MLIVYKFIDKFEEKKMIRLYWYPKLWYADYCIVMIAAFSMQLKV